LAQLESAAQQGSAAKAVVSLEHSCPTVSMAPVLAIVYKGPTPLERLSKVSPTGPSQVEFNMKRLSMKGKQPEKAQRAKKVSCRPTQDKWHEMNRKQRRELIRKM
jgi:hypothetical protein